MKLVAPSRVSIPANAAGTRGAAANWPNLLSFFCERFPHISEAVWQQRFDQGLIQNQQGEALAASTPCTAFLTVFYFRDPPSEEHIPFEEKIVYQDEFLVIADKPHFLPVTPSGKYLQETLLMRLRSRLHLPELTPLHRIDRETAGLVAFAVDSQHRGAWQSQFQRHEATKQYLAVAPLLPMNSGLTEGQAITRESRIERGQHFMQRHEVPGPINAITEVTLLETLPSGHGLYQLTPKTGATHQLRVHMAALGIPILGDRIYPVLLPEHCAASQEPDLPSKTYGNPLQLLAKRLVLHNPITQFTHTFVSTLELAEAGRIPFNLKGLSQ